MILVVEDDDAIRSNIARLLTLEGFEAVAAADGRSGLAHARARRPDLIISDVNMPGMDGFELLVAVRANPTLATTPFMLLTALDDRGSMRRGMTGGADDYLSKPFTRTELLEAVNAQLQSKLAALKEQRFEPDTEPVRLKGYRVTRKIGPPLCIGRRPARGPCTGELKAPPQRSQQLTDRSVG